MNEKVVKRLAALLSVKSIVTILLTVVFAYLAIIGEVSQEFMMVYTVIIAFLLRYADAENQRRGRKQLRRQQGGPVIENHRKLSHS